MQIDIEGSGHSLFFSRPPRGWRQGQRDTRGLHDDGAVPEFRPFHLPFSRSTTNRSPVPEVRARSFCVTPRRLRGVPGILYAADLLGGIFKKARLQMLPYGNITAVSGENQVNVTVREHYVDYRPHIMANIPVR